MTPDQIALLPYRTNVGVMLVRPDGQVFVGERRDTPDAWQMPQGGIDAGETPQQAALRELWEETGIAADRVKIIGQTQDWLSYDLPPDVVPKIWKGRYRGQKQKWFLLRFLGDDADVNLAAHTPPEFSRWHWLAADRLVASIVPFKREVYQQVLDAFAGQL